MNILESLEIKNYRNLKRVRLFSLKDVNIFIGPNNCGKTSILSAIELLAKLTSEENIGFAEQMEGCYCSVLQSHWNRHNFNEAERKFKMCGGKVNLSENEGYNRSTYFEISYAFGSEFVTKYASKHWENTDFKEKLISLVPKIIIEDYDSKGTQAKVVQHLRDLDMAHVKIQQLHPNYAQVQHITYFAEKRFTLEVVKGIVFIDDSRLDTYKKQSIAEYVKKKNLPSTKIPALAGFLAEIVDKRIKDFRHSSMELMFTDGFEDSINKQGSGVRALICLVTDILSAPEDSVILLDEPELGLNPQAKQAFLRFITKNCSDKQFFISTHDPAFLNPWILDARNTSIYLYSPLFDKDTPEKEEPNFITVNLEESKEEPTIFSGYLPHTESLKRIHIYVEGSSDVFVLQRFLVEYLKQKRPKEWINEFNRISVVHLGGNCWKHLLYTILREPYYSFVVLDADKASEAEETCKQYREIRVNAPNIEFHKERPRTLKEGRCYVYCLPEGCVEDLDKNDKVKQEISAFFDVIFNG